MYYALSDNVYLVNGNARSCIYDLNNSKLYNINNLLRDRLEIILSGKESDINESDEITSILLEFQKKGIIEQVEKPRQNDILERKDDDNECRFAWIEITNKCNLRCIHCYNESEATCERFMSLENYKIVVDSLINANIKRIQIIGGEPFFNKDVLKEMLNYSVGKFEYIEIFTNGTLLSDDWYGYLADHRIHIALSVYSYNNNMHDQVTGVKGSHEKTNNTIKKLKDNDIKYRVCNVLMKGIELGKQCTDLYVLSEDKDVVRMTGRANFPLLSDELLRKKLITKESFTEPITKAFCKRLVSGHNCFRNKIYISSDMEVFPCVMERRLKHCIIDESRIITFNEDIKEFNKDKINECSMCEYRYACFDCRPNSLSGDLFEKPWYCTYNPQSGTWNDVESFIDDLRNEWENNV